MRQFFHCGQMGDIVYSLPTVRAIGPGRYVTSLRKDRHDSLATLLRLQSCITEVDHWPDGRPLDWTTPPGTTHDLNLMRMPEYAPLHVRTLIESHALPFGVAVDSRPWLEPDPSWERGKHNRAIVSRSFRYRRPDIDWEAELARLWEDHDTVVFVGLWSEYLDFHEVVDAQTSALPLLYLPTETAADLARIIYESRSFSGNQSFPLSIASATACRIESSARPATGIVCSQIRWRSREFRASASIPFDTR
jgi:hypothetical protein